MLILDQTKVTSQGIEKEHQELLKPIQVDQINELSALGLTVLQSAKMISAKTANPNLRDIYNSKLTEYDFLIDDQKYKLENIKFY